MAVKGTYEAAREVFPSANTVANYFTDLPDRQAIMMMMRTYSLDLWGPGHTDEQQWIGWDPFSDNCKTLLEGTATQLPPPGAEYIDGWQAFYALSDFNNKYNFQQDVIPDTIDKVETVVSNTYDKIKDAAECAVSGAKWVLLAAIVGGGFLLYTWSKNGGKVAVI
jgi:hypothetical protein